MSGIIKMFYKVTKTKAKNWYKNILYISLNFSRYRLANYDPTLFFITIGPGTKVRINNEYSIFTLMGHGAGVWGRINNTMGFDRMMSWGRYKVPWFSGSGMGGGWRPLVNKYREGWRGYIYFFVMGGG